MSMKKNDAIELFTSLHAVRTSEHATFVERANAEQISGDEKKELLALAKKAQTHAKYLARITDNKTLLDAVASQVSALKLTEEQIREIEQDAYSLRKLGELLISFVQKRKVNDEHSFTEAVTLIASGVLEADAVSFGKKMRNKNGGEYGARQAQMSLKLFERLGAAKVRQDSRNKVFVIDTESAVYKKMMKAYDC